MWKLKRKRKEKEAVEDKSAVEVVKEEPTTEQQTGEASEEVPSPKEQQAGDVIEKDLSPEEKQTKEISEETPSSAKTIEEAPPIEEDPPSGVFIFGKKVEGRFKKFLTALFSIFLLPPITIFGLLVIASVGLFAYPFMLLAFCMLLIAMPVFLPFITIIVLISGKGKVYFGLKNKKFALKILGLTFPPRAERQ